jgi:hypothetical protein
MPAYEGATSGTRLMSHQTPPLVLKEDLKAPAPRSPTYQAFGGQESYPTDSGRETMLRNASTPREGRDPSRNEQVVCGNPNAGHG